jgi:hypothetical protein
MIQIRSVRYSLLAAAIFMLATASIVVPAMGQQNEEGEIETLGEKPEEGIITTIKPSPGTIHVVVGPFIGSFWNFYGLNHDNSEPFFNGSGLGHSFRDELKEKIPEAGFDLFTMLYGYGGSLGIDDIARDFELGAYALWGSNSNSSLSSINGVDYLRRARLDIHETVGSLAYEFTTWGNSTFWVGLGMGGGVYRLELVQAPWAGANDPIADQSYTGTNPDYFDRKLTATYLALVPHLQWQHHIDGSPHFLFRLTAGFRSIFDVGPWRDTDENIHLGLPRTGTFGAFGSTMISIGVF